MTSTNQKELPNEKGSMSSDNPIEENTDAESPLTSATTLDNPSFGWSSYAERINGRFAMIGFTALLLIETGTRDTFLHWAGLLK